MGKKLKHTPGPWTYFKEKQEIDVMNMTIFFDTVQFKENGISENLVRLNDDNSEANARLIAAAPEMLECLIEICTYLQTNKLNSILPTSGYHKNMINIIEKATGLTIEEVLNEN
jgi:hypothetical protein